MTEAWATTPNYSSPATHSETDLLPEHETQFQAVLEASLDGFFILESVRDGEATIADFTIEYTNPIAAASINRTPAELIGQSLLHLFPDCKTNGIFERYATVARTGISTTFETFYESREITGWFRNVVVKLKDGVAVSFSDITDRKRAELALQQQDQHFRVALQTARLGSWEHDLTTGVLSCSAQCKANFGLPPEAEFTHETLFAALHPDDRPRVQAAIHQCLEHRTDYEVEERCYHPDGSLHWLIVRGQLVYDSNDVPIRIVGVTLDITERKQFEESLKQSSQRISSILESITDAFVAFDCDWRYTYVNQEAARLLERSSQELIGQRWQDIFPDVAQRHSIIAQQFEQAMAEQTTVRFEAFSRITDRWLDISLFPSPDGLAMYFRDISDRKRAEQRRDVQYAIAHILTEAKTVGEATAAILQALCEHLDWQLGVLWQVGADLPVLRFVDCWQVADADVQEFVKISREMSFSPGTGFPGRVWVDGQPHWVSMLDQDDNFLRARGVSQLGFRSAFGFPIQLGNDILGVIECFSDRLQPPDADLLEMMGAIGYQIGQFVERKRTETALQQREAELRLIMNAVPVLISFIDAEQRYRFSNQQYEDWFGRPETEIAGKHLWEFLGEATYQSLRPYIDRVLAGEAVTFEQRIPYKGGDTRDVIIDYIPRFDAQGKVEGFVALVSDITSRKQAEETLRQSEERLRIAQQSASAGVWDWDIPTNQVFWSREYYHLYGLDPATTPASYENWLNSVVEEDRDRINSAAQEALAQQIDLNVEFRVIHPVHGERWITAIGQTLFDQNKRPLRMTGIALDITQRKQAEQNLQRYQLLSEYSRDIVLYISQDGQILEANQAAIQTYGYTRSQLLALNIADLRASNTLPMLAQQITQASQEGILFETLHQRRDGSQFPVEVSAQSAVIDGQSVVLSVIRDITERKLGEAALRKSEEWARLAIQVGRLGGWRLHLDTSLVEMDPRMREIWGEPEDALMIPLPQVMDRIHPTDRSRVADAVNEAIASQSSGFYEIEYRIVWNDGTERWVLAKGQAQFEGENELRRTVDFFGTLLDITDLKQAEAAIRNGAERLSLAMTAAKLGDWSWNAATDMVTFSEQAAEMFGVPPGPYMTWSQIQTLLHPDDRPFARLQVERAIIEQSDYDIEYRVIQPNGTERWIAAKGHAQYDSFGQVLGMLGVVQDITQRKQSEAEREQLLARERAAREEAEQANRIKDEFLAVLSHELRSPLNPILGWSKLLQSRQFDQQGTKHALEIIERNAKLQTQLIDDLLDVSRILRGKLVLDTTPVDLATVINAAMETVRLSAEAKNIAIQKVLPGDRITISGDAGRLQQIIWNLLSNAIKFTPNGGQVEVRLESLVGRGDREVEGGRGDKGDREVREDGEGLASSPTPSPPSAPSSCYARITVSDTGKGINSKFLPYVFDYFRQEDGTTTRKFGGLGLGLAIVRYLTELHGGTVKAESSGEGRGAKFTVLLPTLETGDRSNHNPSQTPGFAADQVSLSNLRILVADDEPDMRELMGTILHQSGAKVRVVASAIEALEALNTFKPDILISDIGMPGVDGYQLIRQIRNLLPNQGGQIPAIALTAYAGEINHQKALAAGFQRHISKPVEPEALIGAIAALIDIPTLKVRTD
jgi:PAS domain S-box-containing protein